MKFFVDFFYLVGVIIFSALRAGVLYLYAYATAVWRVAKSSSVKTK